MVKTVDIVQYKVLCEIGGQVDVEEWASVASGEREHLRNAVGPNMYRTRL
jgi:hypothetical protein